MKKDYTKYISSLILFGSNGIIASFIPLSSAETVFWRTMTGSILLVIIYAFSKPKLNFIKHKRDFMFVIISGIAMGVSWIYLYEAYNLIGVSLSSLAYYCGPVIVMAVSPLIFKEHLTAVKITGFIIVLIGVVLTNGEVNVTINSIGVVYGFFSAAAHALMVIFSKKSQNVKGLENSMIQLVISFLTVAVYIMFTTHFRLEISSADWLWICILGLVNTGIGYYLYFSSIGNIPVQTVSVLGYLEPLSAVILAMIFLRERMTMLQLIGAVMIIGGALFGECFKIKRKLKK